MKSSTDSAVSRTIRRNSSFRRSRRGRYSGNFIAPFLRSPVPRRRSAGDRAPKKYHKTAGDQVLEQFSDETGGRAFFPYRIDDLARSFQDIGDELRSQYSLAYRSSNPARDGSFRSIKIETDRKNLRVKARKGYYAAKGYSSRSGSLSLSPEG